MLGDRPVKFTSVSERAVLLARRVLNALKGILHKLKAAIFSCAGHNESKISTLRTVISDRQGKNTEPKEAMRGGAELDSTWAAKDNAIAVENGRAEVNISGQEVERSKLEKKNSTLREDISKLRAEVRKLAEEKKQLSNQNAALVKESEVHKCQLMELQVVNGEQGDEIAKLKSLLGKAKGLLLENDMLRSEIANSEVKFAGGIQAVFVRNATYLVGDVLQMICARKADPGKFDASTLRSLLDSLNLALEEVWQDEVVYNVFVGAMADAIKHSPNKQGEVVHWMAVMELHSNSMHELGDAGPYYNVLVLFEDMLLQAGLGVEKIRSDSFERMKNIMKDSEAVEYYCKHHFYISKDPSSEALKFVDGLIEKALVSGPVVHDESTVDTGEVLDFSMTMDARGYEKVELASNTPNNEGKTS
ncbi:hypothetical protein [Pseudomonas sp. MWU13-3659]|uniref:hypothetical protein n=1 Tax=Pseudomonas sp. MWU13-3659 TaxID=2986964 RepID=UPI0020751DB1|nr:hypothetical protein [Pseudomonas sp. MWU13-3659]